MITKMEDIRSLGDVNYIFYSGSGNAEIDSLVKRYFSIKENIYRNLMKFYYNNYTTNRQTMKVYGINLKQYNNIRFDIVSDIREIVKSYYKKRKKQLKRANEGINNISDMLTYRDDKDQKIKDNKRRLGLN